MSSDYAHHARELRKLADHFGLGPEAEARSILMDAAKALDSVPAKPNRYRYRPTLDPFPYVEANDKRYEFSVAHRPSTFDPRPEYEQDKSLYPTDEAPATSTQEVADRLGWTEEVKQLDPLPLVNYYSPEDRYAGHVLPGGLCTFRPRPEYEQDPSKYPWNQR